MVSYALNHEDVLLDRVFPRGKPGFYIDVGANEPVTASVTKHFYDLGWHGINVEPAAHPYELLREARERDINLNVALSDVEGELTLFELPLELSGGSTFSEQNAARHREAGLPYVERKVPTTTLAQVCERYVDGPIDFLSVDVEGHEAQVLQGADWTKWRPRVVVVEATEPTTVIPSHDRWEHILLGADYLFATFDGLNRWYVRSEDADLAPALAVPPNVFDDYVPFGHLKVVQDLQCHTQDLRSLLDQSMRRETAARALNATLVSEVEGFGSEIAMLRAHYERLERALTTARAQYESVREQLAASQATAADLLAKLNGAGGVEALEAQRLSQDTLEGISPASLGVARYLTALSSRHPKTASSVKNALRAGLSIKRKLLP